MADKVEEAVTGLMSAFEEFKSTNDARLKEIEKKGSADPLLDDKLGKIESKLAGFEELNQKATLSAAQAKKIEEETKALAETIDRIETKLGRPGAGGGDEKAKAAAEYKAAFETYLRSNPAAQLPVAAYKTLEDRVAEYKSLVAAADSLGGYYLSPAEMSQEIIKNVILQSPLRALARVTQIGVASLKLPKRTGVFAAKRVGEVENRTETTGYTTGMVEIPCPEMYAEVHISEQMIEDSQFDIQAEMQLEFAEQFAVKEGAEFIAGTGASNQAEGVLTNPSTNSVVSGDATHVTADGLISLFYNGLKTAYAKNATWIMNRATLGTIRKLKDGDGQYLWLPGLAGNIPNTIMGAPYAEMPDMPNISAGTKPVAVGDFFSGYRVVDRVMIAVLRDPFTQSGSGQILFRARKRVGGAVVKGEAIAVLTIST
jgi:HK97 family phage major capsid protein